MQNKTIGCKDLTMYAKNIISLADDLASSAVSLKGQGYSNFVQTREDLKQLINSEEQLCRGCAGKLCRFSTEEDIAKAFSAIAPAVVSEVVLQQ
jgi:hypothetical protein